MNFELWKEEMRKRRKPLEGKSNNSIKSIVYPDIDKESAANNAHLSSIDMLQDFVATKINQDDNNPSLQEEQQVSGLMLREFNDRQYVVDSNGRAVIFNFNGECLLSKSGNIYSSSAISQFVEGWSTVGDGGEYVLPTSSLDGSVLYTFDETAYEFSYLGAGSFSISPNISSTFIQAS